MIEINLFDSNFVGQACSVATQTPRLMRYVRNQTQWDGVTVFTDRWLYDPIVDDVQSRFKIGWLHEGRALHPENYANIGQVAHTFDAIMTHDAGLLASGSPFVKTIRGGSWVAAGHWGLPPKSKNVSMILSEKIQLDGHKLRHAIAEARLPIDLYGPRYTPIGIDKAMAYRDYRYAVVVEACKEDNFFSEHLIDALAFGCVPLYWGCPNIGRYVSIGGMLEFQTVADLANLLTLATPLLYARLRGAVGKAQTDAWQYVVTEDWQIEHCLRPFVGEP